MKRLINRSHKPAEVYFVVVEVLNARARTDTHVHTHTHFFHLLTSSYAAATSRQLWYWYRLISSNSLGMHQIKTTDRRLAPNQSIWQCHIWARIVSVFIDRRGKPSCDEEECKVVLNIEFAFVSWKTDRQVSQIDPMGRFQCERSR